MDKLDTLVTSQLIDRLLEPERLKDMLTALAERRAARSAEVDARLQALEAKAAEADERLQRLYALVENGHTELDDLLKGRIAALKTDREIARVALERAQGARRCQIVIDEARLETFSHLMRQHLTTGDTPFRKAYVGAIIEMRQLVEWALAIGGALDYIEIVINDWREGMDDETEKEVDVIAEELVRAGRRKRHHQDDFGRKIQDLGDQLRERLGRHLNYED